jgi:cytochrome c oxidase subunit 4
MNASASPRTLVGVFILLLAVLSVSAWSSRVLTGMPGTAVALSLAVIKMTLIFAYFMRLRYQSGLIRIFALAGFFWFGLLVLFVSADYFTRG